METLAQIYERHRGDDPAAGLGDKGSTHSYIEVYEKLLKPYRVRSESMARSGESRNEQLRFMEIGVGHGHSLRMWREYMPECWLIGVDKENRFEGIEVFRGQLALWTADATKPEFDTMLPEGQYLDIVIDDASHMATDQVATFGIVKSRMRPGGIYIIEDVLPDRDTICRLTDLHNDCEVIDLRKVKGRIDDVMVVYRF